MGRIIFKLEQAVRVFFELFTRNTINYKTEIGVDFSILGNKGASWATKLDLIGKDSVVYSVGVGEDISWDLSIIERTGAIVHAFDPTPRSMQWLQRQTLSKEFAFHPYGLSDRDGDMNFFEPFSEHKVSYSSERNTQGKSISLPVKRLPTIMNELGHQRVDLLKMDIEGGEYSVLKDMLASNILPKQLYIEFHHRWKSIGNSKTKKAVESLRKAGYKLFYVSPDQLDFCFIR